MSENVCRKTATLERKNEFRESVNVTPENIENIDLTNSQNFLYTDSDVSTVHKFASTVEDYAKKNSNNSPYDETGRSM